MKLAIGSIASGSSGNCYLIKSDKTNILVDAGISAKQIGERLKHFNVDCLPDNVLVTHEHSDHIAGLPVLLKEDINIFASEGTLQGIDNYCRKCRKSGAELYNNKTTVIRAGSRFTIGDIEVSAFEVSHDAAEPLGFSFKKDDACISLITDTGIVTPSCGSYMQKSDILVLESNHDESMLRIGKYPYFLKQRILGKEGHLSNEAAARALCDVLKTDILCGREKQRIVLLAHLSKENNFPQMAKATFSNVMACEGVEENIKIDILSRTEPSALYIID